jgi:predicted transcriptional regulator
VKDGNGTFGRIHDVIKKKYRYSESWTRRELKRLVEKGVLKVKREKRRLRYIL